MDSTKTRILEATERMIAEYGWENVTFRMITSAAGVNLSAINYHFGSREALEDALLPRIIGPLDEGRLKSLKDAQEEVAPEDLDLTRVIRCFLEPMLQFNREHPNQHRMLQGFFTGIKDRNKIREHFKGNIERVHREFVDALFKALPGASKGMIRSYYVLLFALSYLFLHDDAFVGITESLELAITKESLLDDMVLFTATGFSRLLQEQPDDAA